MKDKMDTIMDIKEEPFCLERKLNEMKSEMEESQNPHAALQDEIEYEMVSKMDASLSSDNKFCIKLEIKEERLWENGTFTDVKSSRELTLDSDLVTQNVIKASTSCITGIAEDFPSMESSRESANTSSSDSSRTSRIPIDSVSKQHSSEMKESNLDCKTASTYDEAFLHGNIFTQKSTVKNMTQDSKQPCKCLTCGKSFRKRYDLKRHQLIHSGSKPYACDICDKRFNQLAHLKAHTFAHLDTKPLKCDICDKSFIQPSKLRAHNLTHSGTKPFKCDICDKRFTQLSILKGHMFIHSGSKPYTCNICGKSFNIKRSLMRHTLIHADTKPYECEICEKSFSDRSTLSRHKVTHLGKKPFTCDICEKSFNRRTVLNKHKLRHS